MTRSDLQSKIRMIRDELETRHKYGTVKIANSDGTPVSVELLQAQLYSFIYKLSRFE